MKHDWSRPRSYGFPLRWSFSTIDCYSEYEMKLYVRFLPLYMMKVSSWRLQSMTQFVCHKHVRCPHPPSYFIKMTLIFICVNITINNLFLYYWPKTCISGLIIFSHEWEWLFKTECYCSLLIKYISNYWHFNPCLCYYCVVSINTNSLSFSEYYECLSLFEVKLRFWK